MFMSGSKDHCIYCRTPKGKSKKRNFRSILRWGGRQNGAMETPQHGYWLKSDFGSVSYAVLHLKSTWSGRDGWKTNQFSLQREWILWSNPYYSGELRYSFIYWFIHPFFCSSLHLSSYSWKFKILASWIRICKNMRIHGSESKGQNINKKLQKKNVTPKTQIWTIEKREIIKRFEPWSIFFQCGSRIRIPDPGSGSASK